MTLTTRRILYISFILLFLTITPLVSLYASGYKLGSGLKMEKTGILILDTEPRAAKIFINDKAEQKFWKKYVNLDASYIRTPAKIKNLLPGEHYVKMEIDGYWPWQKKLTIRPGQSTFAEDVTLFKKDVPVLVDSGKYNSAILNKDFISLNQRTSTKIFDLKHEQDFQEVQNEERSATIWDANEKRFIQDGILYSSKSEETPIDLTEFSILPNSIMAFSKNNENEIIFSSKTGLKLLNLKTKQVTPLIENNGIDSWLQKGNQIYFIQKTNFSCDLIIWDIQDKNIKRKINLPISDYSFVNQEHSLINLYDNKHEILFLIDHASPIRALRDTINNIKNFEWVNSSTLIYASDFEIWLYSLGSQQKTLLTRISDKIDQVIWHPSNNYVLFSTDTKINILELDNREKRNITELISLESINDPVLTNQGEILYFLAKIGKQEGLYKLFIQ